MNTASNPSLSEHKSANRRNYRWLMRIARNTRLWLLLSIGLGLASGILLIFQAGLIAYMIGRAASRVGVSIAVLQLPLLLLFTVIVIRAGLAWLREWVGCKTALTIKSDLRERLMKHLLKLSPVESGQLDRGQIITAVMEQIEALHNFFAFYLPQMSLAVCLPLIILVWVFPLNWISGAILLLTAPLIPIFMALVGMGAETVHQKHFQSLAKLGAYFLNTLQGLSTLKVFGRSKQEAKVVYASADEYREQTMRVLRIAFLSSAVLELFSSVAIAIVAVYLGLVLLGLIHFGTPHGITLEYALFILLLAPEFYLPLRKLATHYHAKAEAVAAANEISQVLELPVTESKGVKLADIANALTLECHDLSFNYEGRPLLFQNVNLRITTNECIAIKGPSGTGKSSFIKLIMGLLSPTDGEVIINGMKLESINIDSWMQSIAWIGQRTRLFPGTIRSNLLMANPKVTTSDLQQALQLAHLGAFIANLPQQLDTEVGESNVGLSGGQVQRIALARAYLKNAPLLLLDEPTASLDRRSEQIILTGLQTLRVNKTVIIVSHRDETLQMADRVYQLDNGSLQEVMTMGSRSALVGAYDD